MTIYRSDEEHAEFLKGLRVSDKGSLIVSLLLQHFGMKAWVNPRSDAPHHKDWREHSDDGDVTAEVIVDVKALSYHFTCREDWPFPDYIIDGKYRFDEKSPKPVLYIHLSDDYWHFGLLCVQATRRHWKISTKPAKGKPAVNYAVDPDLVTFYKMPAPVRELFLQTLEEMDGDYRAPEKVT